MVPFAYYSYDTSGSQSNHKNSISHPTVLLFFIMCPLQYDSYTNPYLWVYFAGMFLWVMAMWYCIKYCSTSHPAAQRFAWGVAGGSIVGIQCFVKDALTILSLAEDKRPWTLPWLFYVLLACGASVSISGLMLHTRCMKNYDATYSNAMNSGAMVLSASIMGAVHYHTFSNLQSVYSFGFYPLGLAIILAGLYVLDVGAVTATSVDVEEGLEEGSQNLDSDKDTASESDGSKEISSEEFAEVSLGGDSGKDAASLNDESSEDALELTVPSGDAGDVEDVVITTL